MKLNVTIPDESAADVLAGICVATGWTEGSPKSQTEWASDKCAGWVRDQAKRGLLRQSQAEIVQRIDATAIAVDVAELVAPVGGAAIKGN